VPVARPAGRAARPRRRPAWPAPSPWPAPARAREPWHPPSRWRRLLFYALLGLGPDPLRLFVELFLGGRDPVGGGHGALLDLRQAPVGGLDDAGLLRALLLELLASAAKLGREPLFGGFTRGLHLPAAAVPGFGADSLDLRRRGFLGLTLGSLLDLAPGGLLGLQRHLLELAPCRLGGLPSLCFGLFARPLPSLAESTLPALAHLLGSLSLQGLELAPQVLGLGLDAKVGLLPNPALRFDLGLLGGRRTSLGVVKLGHRLLHRPAGSGIGRRGRGACRCLPTRGLGCGGNALVRLPLEPLPLRLRSCCGLLRGLGMALLRLRCALLGFCLAVLRFAPKMLCLRRPVLGVLGAALGFVGARLRLAQASLELLELRGGLFLGALQALLEGLDLLRRPLLGDAGGLGSGGAEPLHRIAGARLVSAVGRRRRGLPAVAGLGLLAGRWVGFRRRVVAIASIRRRAPPEDSWAALWHAASHFTKIVRRVAQFRQPPPVWVGGRRRRLAITAPPGSPEPLDRRPPPAPP
jgi:hypothetical protein